MWGSVVLGGMSDRNGLDFALRFAGWVASAPAGLGLSRYGGLLLALCGSGRASPCRAQAAPVRFADSPAVAGPAGRRPVRSPCFPAVLAQSSAAQFARRGHAASGPQRARWQWRNSKDLSAPESSAQTAGMWDRDAIGYDRTLRRTSVSACPSTASGWWHPGYCAWRRHEARVHCGAERYAHRRGCGKSCLAPASRPWPICPANTRVARGRRHPPQARGGRDEAS